MRKTITKRNYKLPNAIELESLKLEALCEQLFKFTKDAVKTLGTPKRKRSKSIDAQSFQRVRKAPKLNGSFSVSDIQKVPCQQPKSLYKFQMKKENPITERTPILKPRREVFNETQHTTRTCDIKIGSRRTPIKMGTRSIAVGSAQKKTTKERKIVCLALPRKEMLTYDVCKTDAGIYVRLIGKHDSPKLMNGDRIVAVNGRSLEGCSLEKANFLLGNSGHLVNLILSRIS